MVQVQFSLADVVDPGDSNWSIVITWAYDGNQYKPIATTVERRQTLMELASEIAEFYNQDFKGCE